MVGSLALFVLSLAAMERFACSLRACLGRFHSSSGRRGRAGMDRAGMGQGRAGSGRVGTGQAAGRRRRRAVLMQRRVPARPAPGNIPVLAGRAAPPRLGPLIDDQMMTPPSITTDRRRRSARTSPPPPDRPAEHSAERSEHRRPAANQAGIDPTVERRCHLQTLERRPGRLLPGTLERSNIAAAAAGR